MVKHNHRRFQFNHSPILTTLVLRRGMRALKLTFMPCMRHVRQIVISTQMGLGSDQLKIFPFYGPNIVSKIHQAHRAVPSPKRTTLWSGSYSLHALNSRVFRITQNHTNHISPIDREIQTRYSLSRRLGFGFPKSYWLFVSQRIWNRYGWERREPYIRWRVVVGRHRTAAGKRF